MSDAWRAEVEQTLGGPVGPATLVYQGGGTVAGMGCRFIILTLSLLSTGLCLMVLLAN